MVMCERCGCCSILAGGCAGTCTSCGHHPISECPSCLEKDREIEVLRQFIESIVDDAKHQFDIR